MTALCLALAALALLLAAALLHAERAHSREREALLRRLGCTGGKTAEKRTRHLSPHRAAIDKIKGKESAARRTDR